jgi:Fic family protein
MECLDRFEHFLHDEEHKLPVLVEAGLIHVQFETIHPFLDGNGRRPFVDYIASLRQGHIA